MSKTIALITVSLSVFLLAMFAGIYLWTGHTTNTPACEIKKLEEAVKPKPKIEYHAMILSSTGHHNSVISSHCFAVFCKTADGKAKEHVTISWMPQDLRIRPFAMRPQAGKNLDLVQSLEWAESRHAISDIIVEDGEHPFLLTGTRRGRDAAKNLAVYFRMTGLMEVTKEYKGDLLEQFNLQHVKRLDVE